MMTRFSILFFMTLMLIPIQGLAETPIPAAHPTKELEQKKEQIKKREAELKNKMKTIQSDLKSTKSNLVDLAAKMNENENKLIALEYEIDKKKKQQLTIEVRLEEDKGAISNLILAMERIKRVPPQALLAKPGSPLKTAQSAMLLESMLPSIYERAGQLKTDHDDLARLIQDLEEKEAQVFATSKDLHDQQEKLSVLMKTRQSLYAQTSKDYNRQTAEIKIISAQAKTLKDLMTRIEKKQEQARAYELKKAKELKQAKAQEASFVQKALPKVPMPKAGEAQLPAAGLIKTRFGSTDEYEAQSEGITIQSRPNATVVAPMGGIVEYVGPFRNYGNIILIKHTDNYMSLIARLGQIDMAVGQAVAPGEPIGKTVKNNNDAGHTTLYYELRHKGNPVNPSKKIAGLK